MKKANIYSTTCLTESYWPADQSKPLYEATLGQMLREVAREVPDRFALVKGVADPDMRRRWTYSQLLSDAERVATALLNRFEPGDHIAIWAPNVAEWAFIQYGCAIAGMPLVTISPAFKDRELEYILKQSDAAGLFVIDEYRGHNCYETAKQISEHLPSLRELVPISNFDDFVNTNSKPVTFPSVKPKDPCLIMYTSGTTGYPKGAILHHRGMVNSTSFMAERAGLEIGGVWINVMPMFHMGGAGFAAIGSLTRRATHVLVEAFDPLLFFALIESEKGTYSLLVPTMVEAILNHPERKNYNLSTLNNIQSGASKVEAHLVRRVRSELGCGMTIVFGQTEAHGGFTQTHLDDDPDDQASTIGQPYPQCEVKIAESSTGQVLPVKEEGEICCRGYQTMVGYYKMPEETAKALKNDGWLHTGDLGSMDERGFVKIRGRLKDMIIRGGENIYPAEIENLLIEHPKIAKVTVVGVPDEYWGEQVAAILVPKSFANLPSVEELDQYCLQNLARYKRPRYWYYIDEIPTTQTGKIRKFILRDQIVKGDLKPALDEK